ncbi:hypothetical protein HDV62DRAFT_384339 [Trichoderma sp. SZMC 28011]
MRLVAGLLIGDALGHEAAAIDFSEVRRISILHGFPWRSNRAYKSRARNRNKGPLMFEELGGGWRFLEAEPGARGRFVGGGGSNVCSKQTEQILLVAERETMRQTLCALERFGLIWRGANPPLFWRPNFVAGCDNDNPWAMGEAKRE